GWVAAEGRRTAVYPRPWTIMRSPPERARTVVRLLLPCVSPRIVARPPLDSRAAAPPPCELRVAAAPLSRLPELPCWFAPMPDPDCASCACASWTRPAAGSAETGAATAITAAAPRIIASVRIFFLLRKFLPGRQSGRAFPG